MSRAVKTLIRSTPITIHESDDLALALQVMTWADVRHLPVMAGDAVVGVLSERDILRRYAQVGRAAAARETARAAMSGPPVTVAADDDVTEAIGLVTERGIGCVPVLEGGRLLGIVTRRDLLATELAPAVEGADEPDREGPAWTTLRVDEVMSRDPVTASPEDTIRIVLDRMGRHGIRHLPVIDRERRVIGVLSDRDVRTAVGNPLRAVQSRVAAARIESTRVEQAMTRAPLTLEAGTRLSRAAQVFADHKVGALPIVGDGGRLVGLISYTDVLRAVLGPKANLN